MKLIQMNSLFKGAVLLVFFTLIAGFPSVLAGDDEAKSAESSGKGNEASEKGAENKAPESKSKKVTSHSKAASSEESNAAGDTGGSGHNALAQASGCLVDHAALEDLKRLREELDERRKDIASKESDLKTREQVIADQLRDMEKIRDEISRNNDQKAKEKEARVAKLVDTFLTMSPKSAAKVLGGLEDSLAVLSMSQMDTPHLAKIMNNMEPARSSHLSELLAGVKRSKGLVAPKKGEV